MKVSVADGRQVEVQAIIHMAEETVMLTGVLLVPGLDQNLLSVRELARVGMVAKFVRNSCELARSGDIVHVAPACDGAYLTELLVDMAPLMGCTFATSVVNTPLAAMWHRRLGHVAWSRLMALVKHDMVSGLNMNVEAVRRMQHEFCEICTVTKRCSDPYLTSLSQSQHPLELLHMDLCGPFSVPTPGGARWLMIVIDDCSKFKIVRLLKAKSDVVDAMAELFNA
jgi:hypothetical protein